MSKTPPNRLRVLRAEIKLSQVLAAHKAKISHNRYWRIENGWADPTEAEVVRLARVFKVDPAVAFPALETVPSA